MPPDVLLYNISKVSNIVGIFIILEGMCYIILQVCLLQVVCSKIRQIILYKILKTGSGTKISM